VTAVNLDLFRYSWIYLQAAIVNEDSVSRQSSIDLFRYRWINLQAAGVKEQRQPSIWIYSDIIGFTYKLQE
jgi:hypothetical protein